jgi:hypothetical protein
MNDGTVLVYAGLGLLAYGVYNAINSPDNVVRRDGRPTQILYSDAARIPPGSILKGIRRVHANRTDFIGANGVIYVGYFNDGKIPSSTQAKHGFP